MKELNAKKIISIYVALMLAVGLWSIIDWYIGGEDPLWHILFYFVILPVFALISGFLAAGKVRWYVMPLITPAGVAAVWLLFENGGLRFSLNGLHIACAPSFTASLIGCCIWHLYARCRRAPSGNKTYQRTK